MGILARHAPMLARLVPAELRLHVSEGETKRYAQGEGWLEVFANRARVLIAEAIPPEDLDAGDLRARLEEAERLLSEQEEGIGSPRGAPSARSGDSRRSWRSRRIGRPLPAGEWQRLRPGEPRHLSRELRWKSAR